MQSRRSFVKELAIGTTGLATHLASPLRTDLFASPVESPRENESLLEYIQRKHGAFSSEKYCQLLGAANAYKEGDEIIGLAAADDASRENARKLLQRTTLREVDEHAPHQDPLYQFIKTSQRGSESANWTIGQLKAFLLKM